MYVIIQHNEILGEVQDFDEALQWGKDNCEYGDVQIAHILTTIEESKIQNWERHNGVRAGVDFPATLGTKYR